ncbi:MAG: hypothetical protein MHPSP_003131 [Paramarteilia canceri]
MSAVLAARESAKDILVDGVRLRPKFMTGLSVFQKEFHAKRSSSGSSTKTSFKSIGDASHAWNKLDGRSKQAFAEKALQANRKTLADTLPLVVKAYTDKDAGRKVHQMANSLLVKHYGFPKAPPNPYLLFVKESMKKNPGRGYFSDENKSEWVGTTPEQKQHYLEQYRRMLLTYKVEKDSYLKQLMSKVGNARIN